MIKRKIIENLHFLIILFLIFILAYTNIIPNTYFTGWDNLHPEFNLSQYAKRVVFGAWAEYKGTGAPAAQSDLSEIPRLPILFLLNLILPKNLVRYAFHFLMLFIGSLGIFIYLKKYWIKTDNQRLTNWLSLFGSFYYALNIFSLQQFYISFELFVVQFAFLPFVLISIHKLLTAQSKKNLVLFVIFQLLIAPSAHTPTVFYLSLIFFLIYGFFISLEIKKNLFQSIKTISFLFSLILFIHSYWLIPNLYYILKHSNYVTESRANQLFNQESKWSIIEASNFNNLISGIHYLFTWKDFNFKKLTHEYIFNEWINYYLTPSVYFFLIVFNLLPIFGALYIIFNRKGIYKFAILIIYLISLFSIWLGIFLPSPIIKLIYSSPIIKEAFRNPFTKFQILHSFTLTLLICSSLEEIIALINKIKKHFGKLLSYFLISFSFFSLIYVSLPAFKGQLISEKLKTGIPSEYFKMYTVLSKKNPNSRVLELPFVSDNGWVVHNWNFNDQVAGYKGYQGVGINFFGLPQPYLTSDFARWTETTDFFYHELRQALNSNNPILLKEVLKKYQVKYIIVDESIIYNFKKQYRYTRLHQLLKKTGAFKIWQEKHLSLYQFSIENPNQLLIPKKISFIDKNNAKRIKKDIIFERLGDYIEKKTENNIIFPFVNLYSDFLTNATLSDKLTVIEKKIKLDGNYQVNLNLINDFILKNPFPYKIEYKNKQINFWFPKLKLVVDNQELLFLSVSNTKLKLPKEYDVIIIKTNDKEVLRIKKNQSTFGQINKLGESEFEIIGINYDSNNPSIFYPDTNTIKIKPAINYVNNKLLINRGTKEQKRIAIIQELPNIIVNLKENPPENCSDSKVGSIESYSIQKGLTYVAKDFGVNCHSISKNFLKTNQSYLINIKGENLQGRSIKFFLNYSDDNILTDDFIMPEGNFDQVKSVLPVRTKQQGYLTLNWETRSFGKKSINHLKKVIVSPFPVDLIASITLEKKGNYPVSKTVNNVVIKNYRNYYNFLYYINAKCLVKNCFVGLNTSFDDLWVAFDKHFNILPHYKINGWANIWEISDRTEKIILIYIPEIVSLFLLVLIISYLTYILLKIYLETSLNKKVGTSRL